MTRARILLCGSNYGQAYLSAISAQGDGCELVGVLARGSQRSRDLATRMNVPLHTRVADVRTPVDLACVAVPSSETELIPGLLDRSIHVLTDHPVASETLKRALPRASEGGVVLHVNGHFAGLEAVRAFIQAAATFREQGEVLHVDVLTTDRLLYGALDVLRRALGSVQPKGMTAAPSTTPIRVATGRLGGVSSTLQVQHAEPGTGNRLEDGSVHYFADLRVALAFRSGTLTLLSLAGPVVWTWNFARGAARRGVPGPILMHEGVGMDELAEQRRRVNADALGSALACAREGGKIATDQTSEYLLEVAGTWSEVSAVLFP